ncbi:class I SAM-dependent methyltransferase [Halobellus ruber]|uniref:Methyltransferase domain-containing protein n=1 Tax=Halobellus ruber TaxID=2761102 RepID=A0A7J9SH32_9EURY|nr:methyltransferase domain-containing protein [Halobellus ruber]MBB6646275.1 methyltransferase domain-containing protein [Halobellus ruber]
MSSRFGPGDVRFFDRIAGLYDLVMPSARIGPLREGLAFADRRIGRVVDLAGGTGRASDGLAAAGFDPVVVDRSAGMLRRAREAGHAAVSGDAEALPLCDDAVDAAVIVDALHHLPDPDAGLTEARRVIRPGGVVVVQEFDPRSYRGRLLEAAERLVGFDSTFRAPEALCDRLDDAGFEPRIVREGFEYVVLGRVPRS